MPELWTLGGVAILMKIQVITIMLLVLVFCGGCSTLLAHNSAKTVKPGDPSYEYTRGVYRGARSDCLFMFANPKEPVNGNLRSLVFCFGFVDFPFSLVADTLFLPFDLASYSMNTPSNTALEPTPTAPSVSDKP